MRKGWVLVAVALSLVGILVHFGGRDDLRLPVAEEGIAPADRGGETPRAGPAAAPAPAAGIFGTVRRDGRPAGARVELRFLRAADPALPPFFESLFPPVRHLLAPFSDREPDRVVASDADGAFSFDGVPLGTYEVRAVCDDGQSGRTTATVSRPEQRVRADPAVATGEHTLLGRARYRDGSPFHGWIVLTVGADVRSAWIVSYGAFPLYQPRLSGFGARTEPDGTFRIPGLQAGAWLVSCLVDGRFRATGQWVAVPRPRGYEFIVDRGLVTLAGQVRAEDDGTPIPGATVWAAGFSLDGHGALTSARTDREGKFSLLVPAEGRGVFADAPGFRPCSFDLADDAGEVVIRLARAARARGVVLTREGGRPVAGITVFALPRQGGWFERVLPMGHTVTDSSGRFAFDDLPPGLVSFGARGRGWVSPALGLLGDRRHDPGARELRPGSESEVELRVVPAARLLGVVVDPADAPVSGAVLRTSADWRAEEQGLLASTATSGRDGRFEFTEIVPGMTGDLVVHAPGHGEVTLPLSPLESGGSREIEVRLPPPAADIAAPDEDAAGAAGDLAISGTVLFEDGTAPYWAEVSVTGPGMVDLRGRLVDDLGHFLVTGLPAGTCRVRAFARVGKWFVAEAEVPAGTRGASLVLEPEGPTADADDPVAILTLTVLDPEGRPVDRGMLAVHYRDAQGWQVDWNRIENGRARTIAPDTEEGFWVDVEEARSLSGVRLAAGGTVAGPFDPGEREVKIRLGPERTITGRVCDPGGTPAPGVRVFAVPVYPFDLSRKGGRENSDSSTTHAETITGPDGEFELRSLGDLDYEVGVDVSPAFLDREPVRARAGSRGLRIVLTPGAEKRITVIDDRGRPVPRAAIGLLLVSNDELNGYRGSVAADARGVARLTGLDPARQYTLQISPPDDRPELIAREVRDWSPEDLTVELAAGLFITGLVRDSDGRPARNAAVCGWQLAAFPMGPAEERPDPHPERYPGLLAPRVTVAEDGTFRIGPFWPGKVSLSTMPEGVGRWDNTGRPQEVEAGAVGVALVLATRWDLNITLAGIEDVARWELEYRLAIDSDRPDDFAWHLDRPTWRGDRLVFANLEPENTYSLYVRHRESGRCVLRRGITRETPELDLRLGPGQTLTGRLLLPADLPSPGVQVSGPGFVARGTVDRDGAFEIRGVPPGPCSVGVRIQRGNTMSISHRHVEDGETITIDLRDQ